MDIRDIARFFAFVMATAGGMLSVARIMGP